MSNGHGLTGHSPGRRRILVIEDEPDLARGLRDALEFEQFDVSTCARGREGIKHLREHGTDLVILDLMLPDVNGFTVCEEIRKSHPVIPIIMLTARSQETDKIRGLAAGADDYVTKPFSIGELVARIGAIFRRLYRTSTNETLQIGQATIDLRRHELTCHRKTMALSFYEVEILRLLAERQGEPVTREEIMEKIWGVTSFSSSRTVDNFVLKLRKKIEEDASSPKHILTIYGTGYRLLA
jgi:DNA-binding response OmpR family regulator